MLTFEGMSTPLTLKLIERTKDKQMDVLANDPIHKRAIENFREKIGDVESIDDLINDYDSFSFMMKAFDLEEKIYAKGMMKKVFESDREDKTSLLNRLNDSNMKAMHEAIDFQAGGVTNYNTFSSQWQEEMVDKYLETQYRNAHTETSPNAGTILEMREKAGEVKTWYGILGDAELSDFMRTALGIPKEAIYLDVDKQKELFEKKYDFEKLKDPVELEKLERKYAVLKDLESPPAGATSPILQLVDPYNSGFSALTYDFDALASFSARAAYR
ncbi:DUF1217 domain-containing protein [Sulfitobacter sp. R18_1]|uniref:DUF1217 domain-containing protein n=1 Tax=Sulfitobacter sp. R18_1 TaxID=2821104 RepID=UPI001ADBD377|nr:DUF1217 domain-containing protein [Sulfitobacter sp. R18_1]MBO9428629.1 DUF1217 domain-containing protein [Sulfitobacter sp. R18_1]